MSSVRLVTSPENLVRSLDAASSYCAQGGHSLSYSLLGERVVVVSNRHDPIGDITWAEHLSSIFSSEAYVVNDNRHTRGQVSVVRLSK